jgi:hypothetical protein
LADQLKNILKKLEKQVEILIKSAWIHIVEGRTEPCSKKKIWMK